MQKIQESKIKMSRTVSGILTVFPEIVARTPGLTQAHEELTQLISETERHSQGQLDKGNELTAKKNEARMALETSLRKICAAFAAFATASTDLAVKSLKSKFLITESEIKRQRDMQLFSLAYTVFGNVFPYADKLEPFASSNDVTQLKDLADNYNELLPQKRTQQSRRSLSTQNLEEAIDQIEHLLNDTIDILVNPWEFKEADFYKAFKSARIIVDAASRKNKKPEETTAKLQES